MRLTLLVLLLTAPLMFVRGTQNSRPDVLKTLKAAHPRLLVTDAEVVRAKRLAESDSGARGYLANIRRAGESILGQPTVEYKLIGPRLLSQSRACVDKVYTLAALYRIDRDRKWVERAKKELFAAAAFPDWNPSHFLDTAEMTHAFAVGYDWLYDALSPEDRGRIRAAIVEKGLLRGKEAYEGTKPWRWWTSAIHNWNQVCNGGMVLGALAIADEEPELAAFTIESARKSLPRAMASFAPDGGWAEGPGYWSYTIRYTAPLLAGLETALGTDFGISQAKGFDRAGMFRLYFHGPTGLTFNYADAGDRVDESPWMHWLGRRFKQPLYHWEARTSARRASPLDLFWYDSAGKGPKADRAPLDNFFKGVDVAFLRSEWENPNAIFVGFKGGDNAANHSHLDLGTFVLDALGERWALDLGPDDYNLPAYFGKNRWTYYRLRTEGQNTITLDDQNQNPKAKAPLIGFRSNPDSGCAVADLTAGYAPQAKRVWRGIALAANRKGVIVQDEFESAAPVEYRWLMHTQATVEADGQTAMLSRNGKRLRMRLLSPAGAVFHAESPNIPQPQRPNNGVIRLVVTLPEKTTEARVAIWLAPIASGSESVSPPAVDPLSRWVKRAGPIPAEGLQLTPTN